MPEHFCELRAVDAPVAISIYFIEQVRNGFAFEHLNQVDGAQHELGISDAHAPALVELPKDLVDVLLSELRRQTAIVHQALQQLFTLEAAILVLVQVVKFGKKQTFFFDTEPLQRSVFVEQGLQPLMDLLMVRISRKSRRDLKSIVALYLLVLMAF